MNDIDVIGPDGDDVMGVVGDGPGKCPFLQAETVNEPDAGTACPVTVGDNRFEDVAVDVRDPGGVHRAAQIKGHDLPGHDADHPRLATAGYLDIARLRYAGVQGDRGTDRWAVAGVDHLNAALERPQDSEPDGVVDDAEVGDPPGGKGAPVVEPEPVGSRERGHTDSLFDLEAATDRFSDAVVDMPLSGEHVSMPVIGGKTAPRCRAGVDEWQEFPEVSLRRAFPDHDIHPPEELLSRLV